MNIATTEQIVDALFHLLQTECGDTFKTYGRRVKWWRDVNEQPALFLRHTADDNGHAGEDLPLKTIEAEIFIYSKAPQNPDAIPDTELNSCIGAVEDALATVEARQTLGEAVYRCRIEGRSEYDPGDGGDDQAKAVLTVLMLVP